MRKALLVFAGVSLGLAGIGSLIVSTPAHRQKPQRPDCGADPTTPGIDVSYYQGRIDWPRVRRAGIHFAFIRVSDGAALPDPMFATNWAGAKRANIMRGAYQFFRPDQSPIAQADLMIAAMRNRERGDLVPALDLEIDAGLAAPAVAARALVWIERVRSKLGVEPIVYTGSRMWRYGGVAPLATQPLWIAHYTQDCPVLPRPWTGWRVWQHTDRGAVPGIEGTVDLDLFAGSLDQLRAGP